MNQIAVIYSHELRALELYKATVNKSGVSGENLDREFVCSK